MTIRGLHAFWHVAATKVFLLTLTLSILYCPSAAEWRNSGAQSQKLTKSFRACYFELGFPVNPVNTGNHMLFDCEHQTLDPAPEPIGYTAFLCGPEKVFTDEWQHCTQHMVFGETNALMFSYVWDEELSMIKFPGVVSTFGKFPSRKAFKNISIATEPDESIYTASYVITYSRKSFNPLFVK